MDDPKWDQSPVGVGIIGIHVVSGLLKVVMTVTMNDAAETALCCNPRAVFQRERVMKQRTRQGVSDVAACLITYCTSWCQESAGGHCALDYVGFACGPFSGMTIGPEGILLLAEPHSPAKNSPGAKAAPVACSEDTSIHL